MKPARPARLKPAELAALSPRDFLALKHDPASRAAYDENPPEKRDPSALPRVVFMFWDKGFDAAPEIVKRAAKSWEVMNPGWEIRKLDAESARAMVDIDSFARRPSMAHYSDLLRLELLTRHGGVWADATALCLRPLDDWLPGHFLETGFFAFRRPGRDRALSSWFLASLPGEPLVAEWNWLARGMWDDEMGGAPPYYWMHYLFEYIIRRPGPLRRAWREVPRPAAWPVHQLGHHLAGHRGAEGLAAILAHTPVQKLSHKSGLSLDQLARILHESHPALARELF